MSESENSKTEFHEPAAFGQQLMLAREKVGMSIDEAARALNLKEETVEAIEDSALDRLPPLTFVQGYIRTYARLLGLSEEKIISEFEAEVPHQLETELHPRSPLQGGANSQTPVIKLISVLIIVLAVLLLFYAVYNYYTERTERIEQSSQAADNDAMMQVQHEVPLAGQQAGITEDESSKAAASAEDEAVHTEQEVEAEAAAQPADELQPEQTAKEETAVEVEAVPDAAAREVSIEEIMPATKPKPITGSDLLALSAEQESWAEIVDANDIQLFYGMIKPGRELNLTGQAPFDVFLGNAPAVSLSLNSINIDMTKYIRSNNIAQFKISVENGRARFH